MGGLTDYESYDAVGLAGLVAAGDLSAGELLDEAIERTDAHNPTLNAVVQRCDDEARQRASETLPDSPLAGVPFLIKDIVYQQGLPSTLGSRLFADFVPDHDAELVRRYRDAGLLLFGRTNTPEFGLTTTTEPALYGPCRNPWNLDHTTGGSSGGAGAAVAAGIVPAAHATDGGGSIRIPAACCALVGLKPTRARNPVGPDVSEGWGGMSIGHVVSRSVRDSAAFLDATHGPLQGDPYFAPAFDGSYLAECTDAPGRMRIALDLTPLTGVDADPACVEAARHAAVLCESLGHRVEQASPEFDRMEFLFATGVVVAANVANQIDTRLSVLGRELAADDIEAATRGTLEYGRTITGVDYVKALQILHRTTRVVADFHQHYDLMLTPTLVSPPVALGWLDTRDDDQSSYGERFRNFWGFTNLQNATGQPAISLPLFWTEGDLPVGVQFVGRIGADLTLLQLASQLEQAQPWFERRPSFGR
jgi:amidase